jgi:Fe-S-cluster-containing dehydrogenase component/anaerobic selenocysteine-containing dehydrogenase
VDLARDATPVPQGDGRLLALAGLTGCRWPEEEIVPFAGRPEGYTPGVPRDFATSIELDGVATGLLARSFDGRPVKIEGNPDHPSSLGGSDHFAQARVLELYDPDRSTTLVEVDGGKPRSRSWDDFEAFAETHFGTLRKSRGKGLRILAEPSSSATRGALRKRLLEAMPEARWHEWTPFDLDHEREGLRMVYGVPARVRPVLDQVDTIVCLDADPLGTHPAMLRNTRDFAAGRRGENGRMNRLIVLESGLSVTGTMADHRHPVRASRLPGIVGRLAAELFLKGGLALPEVAADLTPVLESLRAGPVAAPFLEVLVKEILAGPSERVVLLAGPRLPAEAHALVALLNTALRSRGAAVEPEPGDDRPTHAESIADLARSIRDGRVETLLVIGGNPAFDAPADLAFADLLGRVETTIHLGLHRHETGRLCLWDLPRAHPLEAWGDAVSWDGTPGLTQPLIAPLYGGRTPEEILALVLGEKERKSHDLVRKAFGGDEATWRRTLHRGHAPKPERKPLTPRPGADLRGLRRLSAAPPAGDLEIQFSRDTRIHDGRFANAGWLQEMPDPVTKLTWDNAAIVSVRTAHELGLADGDVVRLTLEDRSVEIPVLVLPGQAPGTIGLAAGSGRTRAGRVGDGVGTDVYVLRTTNAMDVASGVTLEKTDRREALATTQDHHVVDIAGRWGQENLKPRLFREATLEHYREHPDFAQHAVHHPPLKSLWQEYEYEAPAGAMAIDLSACTGCGICSIACTAENNVPVVGKDEVLVGREMHWIRIDRSFTGDPENPEVAQQPVACQHCEHAPCEQVCPVAATVHSDEGLNDMVYNRCVGTRYCSNNCPYKVRRFNWFRNHRDMTDIQKMGLNPEVTVRWRGVMEKCTYCVQRIQAVKIEAKREDRAIRDGEILGLPDRQLRVLGRHRPRGTLISAILFLFRQNWRTSINRFAEAMTIFAVMCAGCSRASTWGGSGWPTGSSRIRTRWPCGRTSAARCCGTSSR